MSTRPFLSSKIFLYIFQRCGSIFILSTGCILFLIWLAQFIHAIKLIGGGKISGMLDILSTMTLILPTQLAIILPITLIISCAYILYTFLDDRELATFYSLGLSRLFISLPFLTLSFLAAILLYGINFYVAPYCARLTYKKIHHAGVESFIMNIPHIGSGLESTFLHPNDTITIYIRSINGNFLKGVFIYETRFSQGKSLHYVYTAQEGFIQKDKEGKFHFILRHGTAQTSELGKSPTLLSFENFQYNFSQEETKKIDYLRLSERFFSDLYAPKDLYAKKIKPLLYAELHDRITLSLWAPALVMMALVVLFSLPLNRRKSDRYLVGACLTIVIIRLSATMLFGLSLHMPILVTLMYILPLGIFILGLFLLWHDRFGAC